MAERQREGSVLDTMPTLPGVLEMLLGLNINPQNWETMLAQSYSPNVEDRTAETPQQARIRQAVGRFLEPAPLTNKQYFASVPASPSSLAIAAGFGDIGSGPLGPLVPDVSGEERLVRRIPSRTY